MYQFGGFGFPFGGGFQRGGFGGMPFGGGFGGGMGMPQPFGFQQWQQQRQMFNPQQFGMGGQFGQAQRMAPPMGLLAMGNPGIWDMRQRYDAPVERTGLGPTIALGGGIQPPAERQLPQGSMNPSVGPVMPERRGQGAPMNTGPSAAPYTGRLFPW